MAALGVGDLADLYPAPAQLSEVDNPLPAPGALSVADAVLAHPGAVVVARGPKGAGKTTALRQLSRHLPPGSVVVLFDCFGGGGYLNSGEERHTPQRFVTQVVNELAPQCGTPLLISPPTREEDLWRLLSRTLEGAVGTLDTGGMLVLAVDAADNAAFAASERGDRGFVSGLAELRLPPRATVVLTARSHRVAPLGVPGAATAEIQPFDAATSAAHLRRYRPDASGSDAAQFHTRTDGNPRAQYYTLTQAAQDGLDMRALLEISARTPDAIFHDLVASGLEVSGAGAGGRRWLALMLALARPVSTSALATALGVDPAAVVAFAQGLAPGVTLVGQAIKFRDEDFEAYVRGRVQAPDVVEAHNRLADMFLAMRGSDADAAAHVADHLFTAGRLDEVLQLVVDEDSPAAIPDGFRRVQVQSRRLDLAARAAAETGDAPSAVLVAVRACDSASRLDTLSSMVESRLDLVARYTDMDLLRGHALRQSARNEWLAPAHMRLAAALSRDPAQSAAARAELEHAEAWLRRAMTSPRQETLSWGLDPDDAACAAEARYRLDGLAAAISDLLNTWRPSSFATGVAAALAARVAAEAGPGPVREALRACDVPLAEQAPFLAYASSPDAAPDPGWVGEVVAALLAADPGQFLPWHSRLIDVAVRYGDRGSAATLAQHWTRPLPSNQWEFRSRDSEGVAALRACAVAAVLNRTNLDIDTLIPQSLRPGQMADGRSTAEEPRGHERREWIDTAGPLLNAALLAAKALAGGANAEEVTAFAADAIAGRLEQAKHRWFTFDHSYRAWAALVADAAIDAGVGPAIIGQLATAAADLLRDGAPSLLLELAAVLARRGIEPDQAVDFCFQAAANARSTAFTASDRLDLFARAAEIAGDVDPDLGRQLFDQAIVAATGINDDAARLLAVRADLARRSALAPAARPWIAARLIQLAEMMAPHVTDGDVIPYEEVVGAAATLDPVIGLAAVSRWDDQDRIRLSRTLPAGLLGAIDGGGIPARDALLLDHLVDDDSRRLEYLLAVTDRVRKTSSDPSVARLTLSRTARWIRRDVPARAQPELATSLLAWAAERGLDGHIRAVIEPVAQLSLKDTDRWLQADPPAEAQALLDDPLHRNWTTLAADAALLADGLVSGKQVRTFISAVASAAPSRQRVAVLTAIAGFPDRIGADVTLPVLAGCVNQWRDWPGVTEWATTALPKLVTRHLASLFWWQDTGQLAEHLRAFGDDSTIRHAVLKALPEVRAGLTARDWQNIASLLCGLCDPHESAAALTILLAGQDHSVRNAPEAGVSSSQAGPLPSLLWSAFGHPRREVRWRAAHATRELLSQADQSAATKLATVLVAYIDQPDPGPYRDSGLQFYPFSASAAMLATLARVAADRPGVLAGQVPTLVRHATSGELPHVQIRELARQAAIAAASPGTSMPQGLGLANQPAACLASRKRRHHRDSRTVSEQHRYRFDQLDTIPYWYAPLARVFGVPVDSVAEIAERWILDKWGLSQDDWWTDTRELRDQRSWTRTSHRHGSIPPEESLRLYLEFHAMMAAAGELADKGQAMFIDSWDDAAHGPWGEWLRQYLPLSAGTWITSLRGPVPAEPELFGHLPPLEEWLTPSAADYDRALGLAGGSLPAPVLVAGRTSVQRPGAYSETSIMSALVAPAHASHLQRALAASAEPMDWRLPAEDDGEFEVDHSPYVLRGWLAETPEFGSALDEHDPYAQGIRPSAIILPGQGFRRATRTSPDSTGTCLLGAEGTVLARAEQWADPEARDTSAVTSAGSRVYVERAQLLRYLAEAGMSLIVEVRIGRHRRDAGIDGYEPGRSRIYLIGSSGTVTTR